MPGNFYTPSLQEIAQWPKSNYVNPEERLWLPIYAIIWQILTSFLVVGRLYLRLKGRIGLDDVFLFISWVFSILFTTTACIGVYDYNIGRHIWDVLPTNYDGALFIGWLAQVMFIHSTGAIKVSVLLFYRRMAQDYGKRWLYTVWVLLLITIASWTAAFFAYCFMCQPLNVYWRIHTIELTDMHYTCLDGDALNIATSTITLASDLWTVALPCIMFQCHDLGVSKRQKIGLNIIFCLGFLVTGGGIARTYFLWKMNHEIDLSWNGYDLFAASVAECQLAIMCTCAPFLRAFFRRHMPTVRNMTRSTKSDTVNSSMAGKSSTQVNFSRPRTESSYHSPRKNVFQRDDAMEMDVQPVGEKKGLLVFDRGKAHVVWNQDEEAGQAKRPDSTWI